MSDLMLHGVLNMPLDMWRENDPIFHIQMQGRCVAASQRIKDLEADNEDLQQQFDTAVGRVIKLEAQLVEASDMHATQRKSIRELRGAFEELLGAAVEYQEYEHDGDPWSEDARAMGEMIIDDMARDGRLDKYKQLRDALCKEGE